MDVLPTSLLCFDDNLAQTPAQGDLIPPPNDEQQIDDGSVNDQSIVHVEISTPVAYSDGSGSLVASPGGSPSHGAPAMLVQNPARLKGEDIVRRGCVFFQARASTTSKKKHRLLLMEHQGHVFVYTRVRSLKKALPDFVPKDDLPTDAQLSHTAIKQAMVDLGSPIPGHKHLYYIPPGLPLPYTGTDSHNGLTDQELALLRTVPSEDQSAAESSGFIDSVQVESELRAEVSQLKIENERLLNERLQHQLMASRDAEVQLRTNHVMLRLQLLEKENEALRLQQQVQVEEVKKAREQIRQLLLEATETQAKMALLTKRLASTERVESALTRHTYTPDP